MNKKNIIILISLVSALILIFVLIGPLWSSIKILRQEIIQKKSEITAAEEILDKTEKITQEYQNLEEKGQKIPFALPKERDIPYLLVQFENMTANNGLLLESISFGQISSQKEKDSLSSRNKPFSQTGQNIKSGENQSNQIKKTISPFPVLRLNAKVSGSYNAFKGCLKALENNIRSMDVDSISFAGARGESQIAGSLPSSSIFEFNLGINVYYR